MTAAQVEEFKQYLEILEEPKPAIEEPIVEEPKPTKRRATKKASIEE